MSTVRQQNIHPYTQSVIRSFWRQTRKPGAILDASWIRFVIFLVFAYKLLSRDFSVMAFAPDFLLELYPTDLFAARDDFLMLGYKPIVDLATFHWVHWILPLPDKSLLALIQNTVLALCILVAFLGRGPMNILAIATYCGLTYLFGYLWRAGHDVDAVFITLQIALIYCFTRHSEVTLFQRPNQTHSKDAGWFISMTIFCFVSYYFLSGFNKLTDIAFVDWFRYGLVNEIMSTHDRLVAGTHFSSPDFFKYFEGQNWVDYLGVPAVYFSHLAIPLMYFRRHQIANYFMFYLVFHFMTWGVGILFFGIILTWFTLIPISRIFNPLTITVDDNMTRLAEFLDTFGRMAPFGHLTVERKDGGDNPSISNRLITAREFNGRIQFSGFRAIRRALWMIPVFWLILPLLYLPGVLSLMGWATGLSSTGLQDCSKP